MSPPERGVHMHDLDAMPTRLAAFLQRHRDDVELIEVTEYEPMAGGYSRSMAKALVRYTSDGVSLEETVVLRGDPPAGHSMIETDRDHEWAVLKSLTDLGIIPIPSARYYDSSGEHGYEGNRDGPRRRRLTPSAHREHHRVRRSSDSACSALG